MVSMGVSPLDLESGRESGVESPVRMSVTTISPRAWPELAREVCAQLTNLCRLSHSIPLQHTETTISSNTLYHCSIQRQSLVVTLYTTAADRDNH